MPEPFSSIPPDGTLAVQFEGQRVIYEPGHESYGAALKIAAEIVIDGKWEYFRAKENESNG